MEVAMTPTQWKHLEPHPQSSYKQLFLKGTRIRAEVIYGMLVDGDPPDPTTPEEIAAEMNLPVEAVREAIAYCEDHPRDIERDHAAEETLMKATGMMDESGNYTGRYTILPPEERARLGL
jgi:uncharacterized protein (DUF433 family)